MIRKPFLKSSIFALAIASQVATAGGIERPSKDAFAYSAMTYEQSLAAVKDLTKKCSPTNTQACVDVAYICANNDTFNERNPTEEKCTYKTTVTPLEIGCKAGSVLACYRLYQRKYTMPGTRTGDEFKMVMESLKRGCDSGFALACHYIAPDNPKTPADRKKAVELLSKACDAGAQRACTTAGSIDSKKSKEFARKGCFSCQNGVYDIHDAVDGASSCLARFSGDKKLESDPKGCAGVLKNACKKGFKVACPGYFSMGD